MKTLTKILILCFVAYSATTFAQQKITLVTGSLNAIKGEKKINIKYDFSAMKVGGLDEADYITQQVEKKNKKEAGSGDKWKESWETNKTTKFPEKFEELLNKFLKENNVTAGQDTTNTTYTITLKTTYLEPGYNVGVSRKPAYIDVDILFYKNSDPTNVLAKLVMGNVPGQDAMGYDFDAGGRIAESYAKCGKSLGNYINKNVFKK
jgi:hypothetical protein